MSIYHDSTYDSWSDQVDAGEIGEYMVGARQRHDLPGSMTPAAPYSVGHAVRSHQYEGWENQLPASGIDDSGRPAQADRLETPRLQRFVEACEQARELTAREFGLPLKLVRTMVEGEFSASRTAGRGRPHELVDRVTARFLYHRKRLAT